MTAVTNYCTQRKCILSQFWGRDSKITLTGPKSGYRAGGFASLDALRKNSFLAASGGCQLHSLAASLRQLPRAPVPFLLSVSDLPRPAVSENTVISFRVHLDDPRSSSHLQILNSINVQRPFSYIKWHL